jgi:hypothetical protein
MIKHLYRSTDELKMNQPQAADVMCEEGFFGGHRKGRERYSKNVFIQLLLCVMMMMIEIGKNRVLSAEACVSMLFFDNFTVPVLFGCDYCQ